MIFSFKAYTKEGAKIKSRLKAETLEEAKKIIEEKGLYLISLAQEFFIFKNPFKKPDILLFTEQMSRLLKTQIPLLECFKIMQIEWAKDPLGDVLYKLKKSLEGGESLHQSLEKLGDVFDSFYCRIVEMGEKTAQLPLTFQHLAKEWKAKNQLKKKILSAFSYPLVLFFFSLLLIYLSFFYLIPSLEELFESKASSALTHHLFSISHHLKRFRLTYLIGLFGMPFILKKLTQHPFLRKKIGLWSLKIPFLKHFYITQFLHQLSKSLALLLQANVPLLDSFKLCKNLSNHSFFQRFLANCIYKVQGGYSLSDAMQSEMWLPPLWLTLIAVGEESGQLEESFSQLSEHLEEQLKDQISKAIALLSPFLLLMMGILIGMLALGILIPLTDFQSLAI